VVSVCKEVKYKDKYKDGNNNAAHSMTPTAKAETKVSQHSQVYQSHHVKCSC